VSLIVDVAREIFRPNRERHAIPSLDGPWQPNSRLDEATELQALPEPDDLVSHEGELLVSSGNGVGSRELSGPAGALASRGSQLAVCVEGKGVQILGGKHDGVVLSETDGEPLRHPTAVAFGDDDTLFVCEGSVAEPVSRWNWDLMRKGSTGRVLRFALGAGQARGTTLARGLQFPYGITVWKDRLVFTESWAHRVWTMNLTGGERKMVVKNLPGYPARVRPATAGGLWIALFAMRTQLVDFVLKEDEYREAMIANVDPRWWVCPALSSNDYFLEPAQSGGIRQLGIRKAWSPPRAYGLVVRLNDHFDAAESLHSRVGGHVHGVTGIAEHAGKLCVASKGHGRVMEVQS
jgi:hypothetical protein